MLVGVQAARQTQNIFLKQWLLQNINTGDLEHQYRSYETSVESE